MPGAAVTMLSVTNTTTTRSHSLCKASKQPLDSLEYIDRAIELIKLFLFVYLIDLYCIDSLQSRLHRCSTCIYM